MAGSGRMKNEIVDLRSFQISIGRRFTLAAATKIGMPNILSGLSTGDVVTNSISLIGLLSAGSSQG